MIKEANLARKAKLDEISSSIKIVIKIEADIEEAREKEAIKRIIVNR